MDFDIGVPLPKSHIHNVFEPVNVIRVDNGQTEEKGQVACFRVYVQGNSATQRKGEMALDGTSRARGGRSLDVLDKAKRYQVVWNPTHG